MSSTVPIIIVTGANAGIGFAICRRILLQLCSPTGPADALLPTDRSAKSKRPNSPYASCAGLTLILACRNIDQADKARTRLLSLLESHITRLAKKKDVKYVEHARNFQQNVKIETHILDLASISSTQSFARWVIENHAYVSHLICNAAIAPFAGLNHLGAMKQFTFEPTKATVVPNYLYERTGETSTDGLGLVWQTNFFGHYILFRMLSDLFVKHQNESGVRSRVIWMSTLAASGEGYDPEDLQLIKHSHPYEASKYEVEVTAAFLNSTVLTPEAEGTFKSPCWHLIVQPGVVATTLDKLNSKGFLSVMRDSTLFMARFFGSKDHPKTPFKAAVSASHAALAPLPQENGAGGAPNSDFNTWGPRKIHSQAPMFRKEFVSSSEFRAGWNPVEVEKAAILHRKVEALYSSLTG